MKLYVSGFGQLSIYNYISAIQIRAGVCYTKLRHSRGNSRASIMRDACWAIESLGHIMQVYPKGHDARVKQHKCVCESVADFRRDDDWLIRTQPANKTEAGIR